MKNNASTNEQPATSKMEHTPTPWRIGDAGHTVFGPRVDPYPMESIAPTIISANLSRDNAAFIVRAVNSHQDLVYLLKEQLECWEKGIIVEIRPGADFHTKVRNAIAKAEGK